MFNELRIKAENIRSLNWLGDELVDFAGGGRRFSLSGASTRPIVNYAYAFNTSIVSVSGTYQIIYTRNQTKGLVLKNGDIIREINRSFYHAGAYEYPITFAQLKNGKEVLVHCPNDYCQLDIEEIESGKSLTNRNVRKPSDIFHSRLSVSPGGKWLMSSGWVWHPVDVVGLYDLERAIEDPRVLDSPQIEPPGDWEISSSAFLNGQFLVIGTSDEYFGDAEDENKIASEANKIALWEIGSSKYKYEVLCGGPVGSIFPLTEQFAVSFYKHPKLWDLVKSELVHEWDHIESGQQTSSIIWDKIPPPLALDVKNKRFAVANTEEIIIVTFDIN